MLATCPIVRLLNVSYIHCKLQHITVFFIDSRKSYPRAKEYCALHTRDGKGGHGHVAAEDVCGGRDAAVGIESDLDVHTTSADGADGGNEAACSDAAQYQHDAHPDAMHGDRATAGYHLGIWTVSAGISAFG